jgi:hypothetical protein
MGGHGRTGMVLACVYGLFQDPECLDPIAEIRQKGCEEWVECEKQARFVFKTVGHPYIEIYKDKAFKVMQPTTYPSFPYCSGGIEEKKNENNNSSHDFGIPGLWFD